MLDIRAPLNQQLIAECLSPSDNEAIIQELIKQGADVNCHIEHYNGWRNIHYTPLTAVLESPTCMERALRIVQILIEENRADATLMDRKHYTPLLCVIKEAYKISNFYLPNLSVIKIVVEIVKLLVSHMKQKDLDFSFCPGKYPNEVFSLGKLYFNKAFTALDLVMMPWLRNFKRSDSLFKCKPLETHVVHYAQYKISKILIGSGASIDTVNKEVINSLLKNEVLLYNYLNRKIINLSLIKDVSLNDPLDRKVIEFSLEKEVATQLSLASFFLKNGLELDEKFKAVINRNHILSFFIECNSSRLFKNIENESLLLSKLIYIKKSVKGEKQKSIYNTWLDLITKKAKRQFEKRPEEF